MDYEYLDCDESVTAENLRRILDYLAKHRDIPSQAIEALEGLYKLAYTDKALMSYRCRYCGTEFHIPHVSGKVPTVCKSIDCQKLANRERVSRYRSK